MLSWRLTGCASPWRFGSDYSQSVTRLFPSAPNLGDPAWDNYPSRLCRTPKSVLLPTSLWGSPRWTRSLTQPSTSTYRAGGSARVPTLHDRVSHLSTAGSRRVAVHTREMPLCDDSAGAAPGPHLQALYEPPDANRLPGDELSLYRFYATVPRRCFHTSLVRVSRPR